MSEQLKEVQNERGKNYGSFSTHSKAADDIMEVLRSVNREKNNTTISTNWPDGFETAAFYMVTKLVRLATTPDHADSALDLSSYADLWLKIIEKDNHETDNKKA